MKMLLSICLLTLSMTVIGQVAGPEVPAKLDQATYRKVEQMPIYPGCDEPEYLERDRNKCTAFQVSEFVKNNLVYPTLALQYEREGMCVVSYEIGHDGRVKNVKLMKDQGLGTGAEAVKVIEKMDKEGIVFTPGRENGETKIVTYTMPIRFTHPKRYE